MDKVELLNDDLAWDTEGEYLVLQVGSEIDESDPHYQQVQILAVPRASESDDSLLLPKWEPRQAVRPKTVGKSVKFQGDVKKAKVELTSDSEGADDAFEDGYSLEFPAYVLYWAYRHLSKAARTVDSSLYHDFVARITDVKVRDMVIAKGRSSALYVLHLLEGEFGKNAATAIIDKHNEHSDLTYKQGPADFSMKMRRAREYREQLSSSTLLLLDTLSGLQRGGLQARGDQERQYNQALFNDVMKNLPDTVQCPEKAMKVFEHIDLELRKTDGAIQSSKALASKQSGGGGGRSNGSVHEIRELRPACYEKLAGRTCKKEKCKFGHTKPELDASRKDSEYMERFKKWKEKQKQKDGGSSKPGASNQASGSGSSSKSADKQTGSGKIVFNFGITGVPIPAEPEQETGCAPPPGVGELCSGSGPPQLNSDIVGSEGVSVNKLTAGVKEADKHSEGVSVNMLTALWAWRM